MKDKYYNTMIHRGLYSGPKMYFIAFH